MSKKINWKEIWSDFDKWIDNHKRPCCDKCGKINYNHPEWEDQQKKIQQLVNKKIRIVLFSLDRGNPNE